MLSHTLTLLASALLALTLALTQKGARYTASHLSFPWVSLNLVKKVETRKKSVVKLRQFYVHQ